MPMTLIVTRDVPDRYRGFLASVMPEVAPGVYVSPDVSKAVRERIWAVVSDWWTVPPGVAVVVAWREATASGGLGLLTLGTPPVKLADIDGLLLVRRKCATVDPAT
jgi:CRISPR-associated protein Cas2